MLKQSIKNYFKSLKYFFTPLGTMFLGMMIGFSILIPGMRRDIARRSLFKLILSSVINSVLSAAFVLLAAWCYVLWSGSIYVFLAVLVLFGGVFALTEAYLLHGRGKVKIGEIVNCKNLGFNLLSVIIIFAISLCFALVAFAINKVMGVFVGLAVFEIALIVIDMNAESYVRTSAEKQAENKPIENT